MGRGDGTFGPKQDFPTGRAPRALALADLNGDDQFDVAVVNVGAATVSVLVGHGDGSFGPRTDIAASVSPWPSPLPM
jgi:hypothetical protein